jgi:hypothetical protein
LGTTTSNTYIYDLVSCIKNGTWDKCETTIYHKEWEGLFTTPSDSRLHKVTLLLSIFSGIQKSGLLIQDVAPVDRGFDTAEPAVWDAKPLDLQTTRALTEAEKQVVNQILKGEDEFCWVLANDGHQLTLPKDFGGYLPSGRRAFIMVIAGGAEMSIGEFGEKGGRPAGGIGGDLPGGWRAISRIKSPIPGTLYIENRLATAHRLKIWSRMPEINQLI